MRASLGVREATGETAECYVHKTTFYRTAGLRNFPIYQNCSIFLFSYFLYYADEKQ